MKIFITCVYLQLSKRETATSTNTAVILDGRASHNRSELIHWLWSHERSLLDAVLSTSLLATGLEMKKCQLIMVQNIFRAQKRAAQPGASALKGLRGELPARSGP
jgi:hypothetical protein